MPKVNSDSAILTEALRLEKAGYWIVPCRGKIPLVKGYGENRLSRADLIRHLSGNAKNIALVLNQSDLIDVECDSDYAEEQLQEMFGGEIPKTPTWQSHRGKHRLFHRPEGIPSKATIKLGEIEFLIGNGKAKLTTLPPSKHEKGMRRYWCPGLDILSVPAAELPPEIVDRLRGSQTKPQVTSGDRIPTGERNNSLFRLGCQLKSTGLARDEIKAALCATNSNRCDPPLSTDEVDTIATSAFNQVDGGISSIYLISSTPPVLGEAAYHGFVGDFIKAIHPYTEAADAGVLAHLLPAIGAYIGPKPHVWRGEQQPARINTAVVGPTSKGRKGTSFVPVKMLMQMLDPEFWETQRIGGLSSGEGLISYVSDKKEKNEAGEWETTPVDKRVYVVEPEFSKVLAQIRREQNILSQVLRESFDSGDMSVITRNPLSAKNAHISITGHITPQELIKRLSDVEMANGFANRFLWFYVKAHQELPDSKPFPDGLIRDFSDRLRRILKFVDGVGEVTQSIGATRLWKKLYSELSAERIGLQGELLARGESIVPRLSLIYALLDKSKKILEEHLEAAYAVWQYNEASVRTIFQNKSGNQLADRLFGLLGNGPMMTKEFYSHVAQPAVEIRGALDSLVSAGRIKVTKIPPVGAGRPSEQWERV